MHLLGMSGSASPIFARLAPWATVALVAFVVFRARKGAAKQVATAIAKAQATSESASVASNTVMVNVGHGAGAHIGAEAIDHERPVIASPVPVNAVETYGALVSNTAVESVSLPVGQAPEVGRV